MISLYTTFYNENNIIRKNELLSCIQNNNNNRWIDHIYILNESNEDFKSKKISSIRIEKRPFYSDIINIVNQNTLKDDINIISNTDIFFDKTLKNIYGLLDYTNCIALNRWNITNNKLEFEIGFGQDSWMFKGQIRDKISAYFFNGLPGADNRFAFELKKAGYNVINPSLSIKSFHLHNSGIRNYQSKDLIPSPHYYPIPNILFNKNEGVQLNQLLLWVKVRIIFFNDFYFTIINRKKYRIFRKNVIDFSKKHLPILITIVKKIKNV